MPKIRPVIMCGGSGTRMWPESRESLPKQFIPLIGQRSTFQTISAWSAIPPCSIRLWSSPITNIAFGSPSNCGRSAPRRRSCSSPTGATAPPPSARRRPGRLRATRRRSSLCSPPTMYLRTESNSLRFARRRTQQPTRAKSSPSASRPTIPRPATVTSIRARREWSTVWRLSPRDADGNSLRGRALVIDSSNVLVRSEGQLAAVIGLKDVVVVATGDAVLVADRSQTAKVKKLVASLKAQGYPEATEHRRNYRPWGYYQSIDQGSRYQVKRIVVRPGGRLSLQKHHHRAEHWVVVRGAAEVTLNDKVSLVHENESIYLPIGSTHRLANPGKIDVELIEVQTGSYFGEDDIVRIDDVYNRK